MRRFITLALILLSFIGTAIADDGTAPDPRISLGFTATEKAAFLGEMRQMLVSIQGVLRGIGNGDRELIVRSARYSGNRMARETPIGIKQKTPLAFKELGGPTHMMFEELAVRAADDDLESLTAFTAELMQQCVACHAMFKAD